MMMLPGKHTYAYTYALYVLLTALHTHALYVLLQQVGW